MAFRKKSATASTTADLKMFYVSRWSSEQAAQRFTKFYVNAVAHRYHNALEVTVPCAGADCPVSSAQFTTEEGPVIVELWKNNTVVVSESFDKETAAKLIRQNKSLQRYYRGFIPVHSEAKDMPL